MPAPRVFKFDHLAPLVVTRTLLHETAIRFAEEEFARKGEAPFMWLLGCGSRIVWVETPWENDNEKYASVRAIRRMIDGLQCDCYAHMSEAWVATGALLPKDEDYVQPSQRPKDERDDVLFVASRDRKGESMFTRYLVTIRRHGLNFLGPRIDEDHGFAGGIMGNLFRDEDAT